ncbi:DHHC palmitoyltransferase [Musa troglodytarum]|uniref:S-acyltransferase n=1 Tax=Musa troglodytarum TaxID=320322 RepID=A0A9E7EUL2_9LILI|nr:DHHC palmitoyltransferase [Musa troglodytarum]URD83003.1 DHHC palmitoyltransferase [Musa troglodytarum]
MQGKMHEKSLPRHVSKSNRMIVETSGPSKRLYQVWKGSNKFFLGGRLIFGPDVRSLMLTIPLIVVPVILFSLFVSQKLINEFQHQLGKFIVAFAVLFAAYDIVILFLTSGRDPGIVPRNAHPPEPADNGNSSLRLSSELSGVYGGSSSLPPTKDVFVNGIIVKVKYCNTCMLYRPPRCSHCSICNNCVERFDHHCPWVGQCIGRRNYHFFFMFVSSTTILCLYVFSFCWVNINKIMDAYECNLWGAVLKSPVSGFLIIYTFIGAWFVGGLTTFHIYLICSNQTTYENFRYRYDGKMNPYNHGCFHNVKEVLFSGIPKSMNNFRAKVIEDSARFTSLHSTGQVMAPDLPKPSFDLDIGVKRQTVSAEELEDIQNQFEIMPLERCNTQPPHLIWTDEKGNWDDELVAGFGTKHNWQRTHDIEASSAEFGTESGFGDRFHSEAAR